MWGPTPTPLTHRALAGPTRTGAVCRDGREAHSGGAGHGMALQDRSVVVLLMSPAAAKEVWGGDKAC